jgi:hypothetical protein
MFVDLDSPFVIFAIALIGQGAAAYGGDHLRRRARRLGIGERHYFDTVQAATLTLMALIVGFAFSMAVTRYDLRKTLEEAEANAIGTEYVRAALLPGDGGMHVRELLRDYLDLRIAFYEDRDPQLATGIAQKTARLQDQLWAAMLQPAASQQTPITALVVLGMNDVLNSQGYSQAAWWNRIPLGAWAMMGLMALSCNLLVGYRERRSGKLFLFVLPVIISISFFLIADLDNPRGGAIRVHPQNLLATSQSIRAP